jgi:hypothetical protein
MSSTTGCTSRSDETPYTSVAHELWVFQLHLVHYNSSKYKSFAEAADKPDGLAVFAFFIKVCI